MTEREGDDPALEVRPDLVRHPRAPALADVERLKPPAIDALLQAIVGRPIHTHRRHAAETLPSSSASVNRRRRNPVSTSCSVTGSPFDWFGDLEIEPTRRRPRPAGRGRLTSSRYQTRNHRCRENLGLVRPRRPNVTDRLIEGDA